MCKSAGRLKREKERKQKKEDKDEKHLHVAILHGRNRLEPARLFYPLGKHEEYNKNKEKRKKEKKKET